MLRRQWEYARRWATAEYLQWGCFTRPHTAWLPGNDARSHAEPMHADQEIPQKVEERLPGQKMAWLGWVACCWQLHSSWHVREECVSIGLLCTAWGLQCSAAYGASRTLCENAVLFCFCSLRCELELIARLTSTHQCHTLHTGRQTNKLRNKQTKQVHKTNKQHTEKQTNLNNKVTNTQTKQITRCLPTTSTSSHV